MTVAIEGFHPLRIDVPATPAVAAPSRREARGAAKVEKKRFTDQVAPARIRPDSAAVVKPLNIFVTVIAAIGGAMSLRAFIETVAVFNTHPLIGVGLWVIIELAMLASFFLIAIFNSRGETANAVGAGLVVTVLACGAVFINFIHALLVVQPGSDMSAFIPTDAPLFLRALLADLYFVGQWAVVGIYSAIPLIVLALADFLLRALVRRPEGTRKQRMRAVAKREAAADAAAVADEPVVVATAPTPRAAVAKAVTTRKKVDRVAVLARMTDLYREGSNDAEIKRVLHAEFKVGRSIFEDLRPAAKAEAGVA